MFIARRSPDLRPGMYVLLTSLLLSSLAVGRAPAAGPMPAGEQQKRLGERNRLLEQVRRLKESGSLTERIEKLGRVLGIEKEVFGETHEEVAGTLSWLAELHQQQGDYRAAREARAKVLAIRTALYGRGHWKVTDARLDLEELKQEEGLGREQRRQVARAEDLLARASGLADQRQYAQAIPLAREALRLREQVLGEGHRKTISAVLWVAWLYEQQGDHAGAEPLYRHAAAIRKQVLGEKHPDHAASLNSLALLYKRQGEYAKAEPLYKQALAIRKEVLGERHPDHAASLNNLAALYQLQGDHARAEDLYQQALAIYREVLGEKHPDHARCLNNLASLYVAQGDFVRAEPLCRQALEVRREVLGERHPEYASSLNNLAGLYKLQGEYARAEPLYRQALEVRREVLGVRHPDFAQSLNNLGMLDYTRRLYARAEPLLRQALEIRREVLGVRHPDYAQSLNNLAGLYKLQGDFARAEPLYQQALAIRKDVLGEDHPGYATSLHNLAALHEARGAYAAADGLYGQALAITRRALGEKHYSYAVSLSRLAQLRADQGRSQQGLMLARQALAIVAGQAVATAAAQSQRQQLALSQARRLYLDAVLSLSAGVVASEKGVYDEVLAWKGSVAARQRLQHLFQHGLARTDQGAAREAASDLIQATRRLAALANSTPLPRDLPGYTRRLRELSDEVERLEGRLASLSRDFGLQRQQVRRRTRDVQRALPAGTVLVDLLEYDHYHPPQTGQTGGRWERRLAAFVVAPRAPVERIDLGPAASIAEAVEAWRKSYGWGQHDAGSPGRVLRGRVWEPLQPHLAGARTVLLSPDGALGRLPFAALPGGKAGSYLLEEAAVTVIPVPQLLPELLAPGAGSEEEPSLLLVGDVDYGAGPGVPATPGDSRAAPGQDRGVWGPLEGARQEMEAVQTSFQRRFPRASCNVLRGPRATEEAVRRQARASRFLHVASHGFFAAEGIRSADGISAAVADEVVGFHPGLLSGIVLAGASQPVRPDRDDGILTALEVGALDLSSTELAVLSACETGLGPTAGGEGVLGLQRAFQIAGARATLCSLWQVSDQATMALMKRFYANLWQKGMGKLQAFREAQLWLLRQAGAEQDVTRGFELSEAQPSEKGGRLPPYYWAAFVLAGDWR